MLQRFIVAAACVCTVISPLQAKDIKQNKSHTLTKGQTYRLEKNKINHIDFGGNEVVKVCNVICPPTALGLTNESNIQNPDVLPGAFYPDPFASNQLIPPPQTVGLVFSGGRDGTNPQFGDIPPDTNGVKGKTQFVKGDNTGIICFNDQGVREDFVDSNTQPFSNLDLDFSVNEVNGDARIRYDDTSERFFSINLARNQFSSLKNNGVSITFSDTGILSDSTTWSTFTIFNHSVIPDSNGCPGDIGLFADYENMAIDAKAIYIGFNMFKVADAPAGDAEGSEEGGKGEVFRPIPAGQEGAGVRSNFTGSMLLVIQKESLLGDGPVVVTAFRNLPVFTLQPAMNSDPNPKYGYAIGSDLIYEGKLRFVRIVNPGSDSPSLTSFMPLNILATASADADVPESGVEYKENTYAEKGRLTYFDDRLLEAHVADNQLYTAMNVLTDSTGVANFNGDRMSSQWYQFDVSGGKNTIPTLVQAGTLFDPSPTDPLYYIFPAIMTNIRGDLSICTTVSGKNQSISGGFVGRLSSDPLGTLRIGTVPPSVFVVGSDPYTRAILSRPVGQRWGDMSYSNLDPADHMTIWTIQEIARNGAVDTVVARLDAP